MLKSCWVLVVVAGLLWVGASWAEEAPTIRLNSLGFLVDSPKRATVVGACEEVEVKRVSDGEVVWRGVPSGPMRQGDVGQEVWRVDFGDLREPGRYIVEAPGIGDSDEFEIGMGVYDGALRAAIRGFYLWRCGTAVDGEHGGERYRHEACHLEDGYLDYVGGEGERKDGVGGWHDAGDYGKYVVNAGVTVGVLFLAWEHFGERIGRVPLGLPEDAPGYPEFLRELKWQTDWLLKMPYPDGSGRVSHKLTRLNFSGMVMPETDRERRYFTEWSSAATADFAAMMALAARHFAAYDPAYAERCLEAARHSYAYLRENPVDHRFRQGDFRTGGYGSRDADDRLWAAAELWETTGEEAYLRDCEAGIRAARRKVDENWDWSNVHNLGAFRYVLSERPGRDPALLEEVRAEVLGVADGIVSAAAADVYGRPLGERYYWGCNGGVVRQVVNLQVANRLAPNPAYPHAALDAIAHVYGRNVYGRSYVTGVGARPPMHPHDRRSEADGIEAPWPGYLVGGPNRSATDWQDDSQDYRTNEIAINWQAALVYALAGFAGEPGDSGGASAQTPAPDASARASFGRIAAE